MEALECGASTGTLAILLAPKLKRVVASDFSPNMLAIIKEKCDQLNIHNVATLMFNPMHVHGASVN